MDELRPPKELADLWFGPEPAPENVEAIARRALSDAAKYARKVRNIDFMWVVPSAIFAVGMWWPVAGQSAAGYLFCVFASLILVVNIVEWWRFRVAACHPLDPSLPTHDHVSFSVEYLTLRARFLRRTLWWALILLPAGAIAAAARAVMGDPSGALDNWLFAGVMLFAVVLGLWMTRYELRRIAEKQSSLQQILADLAADPPAA